METETYQERLDREQAEARKAYADLYNGVAAHLTGWRVVLPEEDANNRYYYERTRLKNDAGQTIYLKLDRGKIHISGSWPQRKQPGGPFVSPSDVREESPSINCALGRGYEVIARDITRRFLPEYQRIWAKCQAKIEADERYENTRAANWARIAAMPVVKTSTHRQETGDVIIGKLDHNGSRNLSNGYGDVSMEGENSVKIELRSLPVDVAEIILRALEGVRS